MLINPSKSTNMLFSSAKLYAPQLLFEEIVRNKESIISRSKLSDEKIEFLISILKKKITIVDEKEFSSRKKEAADICPDPKDVAYFALALHLNCPLWSNEKKLKEQNKVKVYATHEVLKMMS